MLPKNLGSYPICDDRQFKTFCHVLIASVDDLAVAVSAFDGMKKEVDAATSNHREDK